MNASKLLTIGLLFAPVVLMAQKREDILSIQRDVAQLQDQVRQMQASQDEKIMALQKLVQQSLDATTQLAATMTALQRNLGDSQTKIEGPVATLGAKVDQMSDDFRSVRENVADLSTRMNKLDTKLTDISSAIRTLSAPPVAPPPGPGSPTAAGGPPQGVSAEVLYQDAFRDYTSGKDELAMKEFLDFLKFFPQDAMAPNAQFYIAQMYDRAKQYDDAVLAFDAVLERFPENPKSADALYMKGVDLMKANRKTDAGLEFKNFLKRYPNHNLAPKAKQHLVELGLASSRPAPRRR